MTKALTTTQPRVSKGRRLRLWVHRLALLLVILTPLIFVVAALGYKFGLLDLGFSFGTLTRKVGPAFLMASAGIGGIGLLMGLLIKPRKGILVSLLAIAVGGLGLNHAKSVSKKVLSLPFIHDITTDTQNPPMFTSSILSERAKTERVNTVDYAGKRVRPDGELVSVLQAKSYPDIQPVILAQSPEAVFDQAKSAVKAMGWVLVSEDKAAGLIEATDTTFWYGFKDDVIIRITPSETGAVLDVRSVSRIGMSDMGANAKRIREFIEALN